MKRFGLAALVLTIASQTLATGFAGNVVSYNAGSAPASRWYFDGSWQFVEKIPLTDPTAALGKPTGYVTEPYQATGAIVSVFSPAADPDQIVSIGEGGSLTLELENYAVSGPGAEVGLFTNVGLADDAWPGGQAGSPAVTLGVDEVVIEVSTHGSTWVSLGAISPNVPTSVWTDATGPYMTSAAGLAEADFSDPFTGSLSNFDGKSYSEIQTLLGGTGGGYWLDLSATGLDRVGYIRFSVPDDGDAGSFLNFELDAVSVAADRLGVPVPEPCSIVLLAAGGAGLMLRRKK